MHCLVGESERRAAFAAARELCRREPRAGDSAVFFLPRPKRDGVHAVRAFAQLIQQALATDGPAGECCSGAGSVAPLLKSRVEAMYAGDVQVPLPQFRDPTQWTMLAAAETVRRFDVPRQLWIGLIDGLAAAGGAMRLATWRSLEAHLDATGGNIGRIIAAVLGATHSEAGEFASAIGRAARLTGILRNLRRDLARNRLLLPIEDLARFRYSEREMLAGTVNDSFRALARCEIERARSLFGAGAVGACWLAGDGSRMAAGTFIALQLAMLDRIEQDVDALLRDEPPGEQSTLVARLRSLPLAWRIARRQAADPMPELR